MRILAGHAGFPLEGTKRGESRHRDGWHDMHLHARLAGDPRPALAGMMPWGLGGKTTVE